MIEKYSYGEYAIVYNGQIYNTKELREILGDVPLDTYEVIKWIEDYLNEGYASIA